ncbi:ankyrin repeat domain-containing protein SOWAHD [Pristis pectinata]|uniref:ankyrin repeat domain-containing protein SOWAHD n=1 Tax=Pristis pectinata TaxID=685728 RepID=UPI00223DB99A|nr:ankyrin repeat domain-containing protein SOWAHD [Pristis pectinata]
MFEKIAETRRARLPAEEKEGGDRTAVGDGGRCPSYGQVLEDVNRLSHLLGRFLQAADGLVSATGARALRRTGSSSSALRRPGPRRSVRLDSGAGTGAGAQGGRRSEAETEEEEEEVGEGSAEHQWMVAAAGGDLGRLAALLDREPDLLNRRDPVSGLTAGHWLAKRGDHGALLELVRLAESRGLRLDLNSRAGGGGHTPLHLAAMQGHQMVIKLLVGAYNADVDARDYGGRKAWHYLGSGVPSQLRELVGGQREEPLPGTSTQPPQEEENQAADKPQLPRMASLPRFFQPSYWRRWKTQRSRD